jgi:Beta-L-arabinofuranosidase, GH127
LYVSSRATFDIGGSSMTLSIKSEMPWGGATTIAIASAKDVKAAIKLRVPGWAVNRPAPGGLYKYVDGAEGDTAVSIDGKRIDISPDANGYITLDRLWRDGDVIGIDFPVSARRLVADPRLRESRGRVAVERGPLVYCAEWPEIENRRALDLLFDPASPLTPEIDGSLLGGVAAVRTMARRVSDPSAPSQPIRLVPYSVWANRGAGEMSVWLSIRAYEVGDTGPAGGLIFYVNPNAAADGWRYLEAAPVDQSAGAKWGCFRTLRCDRHRASEHPRHPRGLLRPRHRGRSLRQLQPQRHWRMVSPVARRAGAHVSSLESGGHW